MNSVVFAGVRLTLPPLWSEATHELAPGSPPTLVRGPDGSGVLQFSIAKYQGGKTPDVTVTALHSLLSDFATSHNLGSPSNLKNAKEPNMLVSADFATAADFIRVYYVSDGQDIALITYVGDKGSSVFATELRQADSIVNSLRF